MLIVSGCRTCHTLPKNILYEQYSYKNISLGYVYIEKGKLRINIEEPLCSKCNYGDGEFVDDNVYILKVINYSVNKKHRDLRRTKLLTDIGSKQQELKINQELTFDKWYIETHPR